MTKIRMNRAIVATLVLLLIQTSVLPWLVPAAWSGRLLLHLPFVMTVFVALLGGRHRAFFVRTRVRVARGYAVLRPYDRRVRFRHGPVRIFDRARLRAQA
ncbi:hypothetical protein [Cohnella rhizosphaerae]|uniref:Uncharacterized protein n=1 Tax=Cohnella rhizosphaerae TaxID=1457232 RepID=A0A9X4KYP8_9BACL|nr:hypothetical protein [Cohnella rhizosphaerae]MDG0813705.1 hypothetical protein [Cohnella rhizosphaerae]